MYLLWVQYDPYHPHPKRPPLLNQAQQTALPVTQNRHYKLKPRAVQIALPKHCMVLLEGSRVVSTYRDMWLKVLQVGIPRNSLLTYDLLPKLPISFQHTKDATEQALMFGLSLQSSVLQLRPGDDRRPLYRRPPNSKTPQEQ